MTERIALADATTAAGRRRWACLVTGPLQAVAAVEALLAFEASGAVFYYAGQPPAGLVSDLCRRAGVRLIWLRRGTRIERLRSLLAVTAAAVWATRLMIGSLHQRPFLLAALVARRELVLVDDGSLTEAVVARRVAGAPARSWLGRRVDRRPLGVFSIYSPALRPGDRLIPNRLARVRGLFGDPPSRADEAWVIGQPFVDAGLTSQQAYRSLIAPFVRRMEARGLPLTYVRHPRESERAAREICAELDLAPVRFDGPVELEVLARGRAPAALFSISSSLLDTLPVLLAGCRAAPELWTVPLDAALDALPERNAARLQALHQRRDLRVA